MRTIRPITTLCGIALTALLAAPADAANTRTYRITNATGAPAPDLHVTFAFAGGSLSTVVLADPPGCPPATDGTIGNSLVLDWGGTGGGAKKH